MDLKSILNEHRSRKSGTKEVSHIEQILNYVTIPDIFFDEVLLKFKLTRVEILALIFLYRKTWLTPNLNQKYGISPMLGHREFAKQLEIEIELLQQTLRKLEEFGFIETMRSGLYFVRRYFTEELDKRYGQNYDNFL